MSTLGLVLVVVLILAFTGGMYGGPNFYGAGPYLGAIVPALVWLFFT